MISVLLPCYREMRHGYLPAIAQNLATQDGAKEIIAVVTPSEDDTESFLQQQPQIRVIVDPTATNRAQRFNRAIAASRGEVILLHHPATLLPATTALGQIAAALTDPRVLWGGFRHRFDDDHWLLRFTSWYSNHGRGRWGRILYFDHCPFVRRDLLQKLGGVPDLDIFEDTALSDRLAYYAPPHLLPGTVTTSARRFRQRGIYRHALLNQGLKLAYRLGVRPQTLNRWYERSAPITVSHWPKPTVNRWQK
ncbi:MAG: glycosyltransferase family 2 protein [Oscillatoriales cyanobacterium SM2_2_1]|nr:glycosyltransferase family 2 protein [Oscillatoriales cyanobacterium SM2_2_1]